MISQCSTTTCASQPPFHSSHVHDGATQVVNGTTCYVTGDECQQKAIIMVYDIFGLHSSTKHGADLLAKAGYLVIMPDFFNGEPLAEHLFPPKSEEDEHKVQEFFSSRALPSQYLEQFSKVEDWVLRTKFISEIVYVGLCWGAQLCLLQADGNSRCRALILPHPSMLNPTDALKVRVPVFLLASKDEPEDLVEQFQNHLPMVVREKSRFSFYKTMSHGWTGARANFDCPETNRQFYDAYSAIISFLEGVF